MSNCRQDAVSHMRLARAAVIVLAIFLMVPTIDVLVRASEEDVVAPAMPVGIDAKALVDASDAFAVVEHIEEATQSTNAIVDEALSREVGGIAGARDIRVSGSGEILGFVVDADCDETSRLLDDHMAQKGWYAVPLNGVTGATYVKEDGEYRWALATCTQVGSATSVVIRVKQEEG